MTLHRFLNLFDYTQNREKIIRIYVLMKSILTLFILSEHSIWCCYDVRHILFSAMQLLIKAVASVGLVSYLHGTRLVSRSFSCLASGSTQIASNIICVIRHNPNTWLDLIRVLQISRVCNTAALGGLPCQFMNNVNLEILNNENGAVYHMNT